MKNASAARLPKLFLLVCAVALTSATAQWDLVPDNWVHRVHPTNGLWYDLYIPYDSLLEQGKTYPMVLALHGCCMSDDSDPGQVVVGVDAIYRTWHGYGGNTQLEPTWIVAPGSSGNWDDKRARLFEIMDDLIDEFPIDTQRIIITGFSMGGRGSFTFANARPDFFSAIIPAAAAIQSAGDFSIDNIKDIPTWGGVCSGDDWRDNHELSVSPVRASHGDDRGNYPFATGVNPRFNLFMQDGHGEAMSLLYGETVNGIGVTEWGLSRVNDGNIYPYVRFTSHAHEDTIDPGLIRFTVDARDDGAITKVEFYLKHSGINDQQLIATDTEAPWEADIFISGERNSIFHIDGSVDVYAIAYDNGLSQGYTMDKSQTAYIHVATTGATGARSARDAHRTMAGVSCATHDSNMRVTLSRPAPATIHLLTPNGRAVESTTAPGAGVHVLCTNGLSRGSYLLQVVQQGTTSTFRVTLGSSPR